MFSFSKERIDHCQSEGLGSGMADERPTQMTDANNTGFLTKTMVIDEVSAKGDVTLKDAALIVKCILDSIVRALRRGDKVEIRGFGTFRTRQRQARVGRNPKTSARVEVPPKKIPYFKPSRELRELVDKT